jgi:hypothetical protein
MAEYIHNTAAVNEEFSSISTVYFLKILGEKSVFCRRYLTTEQFFWHFYPAHVMMGSAS